MGAYIETTWNVLTSKTKIEDAINERGIQGHQEADRRHEKLEGPDKVFVRQLFKADIPFLVRGM